MSGGSMMGSGMMAHGQSLSLTFRMPGTYQYYCLGAFLGSTLLTLPFRLRCFLPPPDA